MTISKPKTIDEYINVFPTEMRPVLEQIRNTILNAMPGAEETITYDMPTFKLSGKTIIYFAGWKKHIALYPVNPAIADALKDELAAYKGTKDSIHFPLNKPMPLELITKVVEVKVSEFVKKQNAAN